MIPRPPELRSPPELPVDDGIDIVCDAFEDEWRLGREPRIEDFLDRVAKSGRRGLLRELLALELDYRRQRGEAAGLDEYERRFPAELGAVLDLFLSSDEPRGADRARLLARAQPFSLLPDSLLRLLGSCCDERRFAAREVLIRQGDPAASLVVLCDGGVEVCVEQPGGSPRVLARLEGAQVFGEMALLTEEPCTASVVAAGEVRALVLPAATFHRLARLYPEISVVLTLLVASRLGMAEGDVLAGKVLNRYRIAHRLGSGGMSVVYAATDLSSGRPVALKMLSHRLVYDPARIAQFQREADLVESFDHPNIVRMLGRFSAFHTCFLVMELCEGRTLKAVIQSDGPQEERAAQAILGQIACALAHAHAAGVIHRDIKPANVMLTDQGIVKLMDFGLSKPLMDGDPRLLNLLIGTPRYMAPEQLLGQPVGPTADLFALGCVGFELLTARPLFPVNDVGELRRQHSDLLASGVAELQAEASPLRQLLVGCLQAVPDERRIDLRQLAAWAAPVSAAQTRSGLG